MTRSKTHESLSIPALPDFELFILPIVIDALFLNNEYALYPF